MAAFFAEHNVSLHIIDHLTPLLIEIFPDSKIDKDINFGRTKCTSIIKNVLTHIQDEDLNKYLQKTNFSLLVDESTDFAGKLYAYLYDIPKSLSVYHKFFN